MNINRVVLTGNLTRDPELRSTGNGLSVCKLGVACNTRRKNNSTGEWEEKPNFFRTPDEPVPWHGGQNSDLLRAAAEVAQAYRFRPDPRYLACFPSTRSEIVVPIHLDGRVVGEIDIDSDRPAAFGDDDRAFLERVAELIAGSVSSPTVAHPADPQG